MKLSPTQMAQAVTKARSMIKEHSTGFMNFNKMVSDDQISAGLTELLAVVADDQKPGAAS
jgi:uncharacterized protein YjgD (DUF1641 family)